MERLEKFCQTLGRTGRVWSENTSYKKKLVSSFPLQSALTFFFSVSLLAPAEMLSVTFYDFTSDVDVFALNKCILIEDETVVMLMSSSLTS